MTYKKSSVKHTVKKDFLQCLKSEFVFPAVSFITIFASFLMNYTSALSNGYKYRYVLFGANMYSLGITLIVPVIIAAGALTAISAFKFLYKVPSTNVYLSLPITRNDLIKNRLAAGTIYIAVASFLPIALAVVMNFAAFKFYSPLISVAAIFAITFFVAGMLGFGVGTAVSVAVGRRSEAVYYSCVILAAPSIVLSALSNLFFTYTNGAVNYVNSSVLSYLYENPFDNSFWISPLSFHQQLDDIKYWEYSSDLPKITVDMYGPVIIMAIAACIALAISFKIFANRKAESATVVGASRTLVVTAGCIFGFSALAVATDIFSNVAISIIFAIIVGAVVYLLLTMLMYRNKKKIIKNFKVIPITAVVSLVIILVFYSGFFGIYNKVPKIENVKYAYAVAGASDGYLTSLAQSSEIDGAYAHDTIIGKITDSDDLTQLLSIHKAVTKELGDGDGVFKVAYIMNDGTSYVRSYYNVGDNATKETYKLYDTKAYKEQIQYGFTASETEIIKIMSMLDGSSYDYGAEYPQVSNAEKDILRTQYAAYQNMSKHNDIYLTDKTMLNTVDIYQALNYDDNLVKELKSCMAQDLANMTSDDLCGNKMDAEYYIAIASYNTSYDFESEDEAFVYTSIDAEFPIYANMTNTLAFLEKYNIKVDTFKVEDISSVSYFDASNRFATSVWLDMFYVSIADDCIDSKFYTYNMTKDELKAYELDWAENFFGSDVTKNYDYNGSETTDANNIKAMYDASWSIYTVGEESGKIALFKTKDGEAFTMYVSEKDIPEFAK